MIRLFAGHDMREGVGFHVFLSSVLRRTTHPLMVVPLWETQADGGSTTFSHVRFDVPRLCAYDGWAIFADGCDQLCLADIADLWALRDERFAIQVVKHEYRTKHPVKYLGTSMQCPNIDYPRKNWSSLALINCAAPEWQSIPEDARARQRLAWIVPDRIGDIPAEWNVLVDESGPAEGAKILHWTAGIPAFMHYAHAPCAEVWRSEFDAMVKPDAC